jgi:hypothetical protein
MVHIVSSYILVVKKTVYAALVAATGLANNEIASVLETVFPAITVVQLTEPGPTA